MRVGAAVGTLALAIGCNLVVDPARHTARSQDGGGDAADGGQSDGVDGGELDGGELDGGPAGCVAEVPTWASAPPVAPRLGEPRTLDGVIVDGVDALSLAIHRDEISVLVHQRIDGERALRLHHLDADGDPRGVTEVELETPATAQETVSLRAVDDRLIAIAVGEREAGCDPASGSTFCGGLWAGEVPRDPTARVVLPLAPVADYKGTGVAGIAERRGAGGSPRLVWQGDPRPLEPNAQSAAEPGSSPFGRATDVPATPTLRWESTHPDVVGSAGELVAIDGREGVHLWDGLASELHFQAIPVHFGRPAFAASGAHHVLWWADPMRVERSVLTMQRLRCATTAGRVSCDACGAPLDFPALVPEGEAFALAMRELPGGFALAFGLRSGGLDGDAAVHLVLLDDAGVPVALTDGPSSILDSGFGQVDALAIDAVEDDEGVRVVVGYAHLTPFVGSHEASFVTVRIPR